MSVVYADNPQKPNVQQTYKLSNFQKETHLASTQVPSKFSDRIQGTWSVGVFCLFAF